MGEFGFKLMETRSINIDQFDASLLNAVLLKEPSFKICLSCGGCTATCNAGTLIDFNIRKLNLFIRRGETSGLTKEIDKCMLCGKCQLVCPRGINLRHVVMLLKKELVKDRK